MEADQLAVFSMIYTSKDMSLATRVTQGDLDKLELELIHVLDEMLPHEFAVICNCITGENPVNFDSFLQAGIDDIISWLEHEGEE